MGGISWLEEPLEHTVKTFKVELDRKWDEVS